MINIVIYILILLAASGIDLLPAYVLSHENAIMLQYVIYCTLIVFWAVRAGDRLSGRGIVMTHRILVFQFILTMFFSCLQRVVFAGVYPWEHVFWYLHYLPFLGIALVSWYMTLYAGRDESYRLPAGAKLLLVTLFTAGLLYTILFSFDRSPTGIGYIEPHVMVCFSAMGLWEVCIMMRLIPSNGGYGRWFGVCSVPMEIIDRKGIIRYASKGHAQLNDPQAQAARDYVTRSFPIAGGIVRWHEDVTNLQDVIRELETVAQTLARSNEKLEAQNRMQLQEAKVKERTRLYDKALGETGDRMDRIGTLLSDCASLTGLSGEEETKQREMLAVIGLLGAYVKRRSNLVLLAHRSDTLPLSELHFCLRESNEALALIPVSTIYVNETDDAVSVPARDIMRLYDTFQKKIEETLQEMEYLKMTLTQEEAGVLLTLQIGGADMPDERVRIPLTQRGSAA